MKRLKVFYRRVIRIIKLKEMRILPGHLSFYFVIAIIPLTALIGLIGSKVMTSEFIGLLENNAPNAVLNIFSSIANHESAGYSIALFIILSFFLASNGTYAIILVSNTIYKVDKERYFRNKIKALIMTIVLVLLLLFITLIPTFGDFIISFIKEYYHGNVTEIISKTYQILKYPISILAIFVGIKILYTMAPDKKMKSKFTNYGALFTTLTWVILTRMYSFYLDSIKTYNIFYGSLSNILILMLWMYFLAYLFTLGMALNVDKYIEET